MEVVTYGIKSIIEDHCEGNISLEDALIMLEEKRNEIEEELSFIKQFKDENSENISQLATEYKEGYKGYSFQVKNGSKRFDYKGIPEWDNLHKQIKNTEEKYKSMYIAKMNGSKFANYDDNVEELKLPTLKISKSSVMVKKI